MNNHNKPLVVGAGPVGLGAALFLAREGRMPRVVEMREEPAPWSKALAVNPRTLDMLVSTGVTRQMLERGLPIRGVRFYRGAKEFGGFSLAGIHPRYPFMLGLSQATTERLLSDAFTAAGGGVQRGVKMVDCGNVDEGVEAVLEPVAGGPRETIQCPWMLAADGAHSTARQALSIGFPGATFADEWYLADVPLRTTLAADQAHVILLDRGEMLFLIRVVDDVRNERGPDAVWRVIRNRPEPLAHLVNAEPAGPPIWTSSFRVAHQIAATLAKGHVYLAGDAAHVHSPVGARGMNLGLEDAWVFAKLARANRLADYNRLRRPIDERVVRQVELLSRVAAPESLFYRFVRAFIFPRVIQIPFLRRRMMTTVTGLDHPLPEFHGSATNRMPARRQAARSWLTGVAEGLARRVRRT